MLGEGMNWDPVLGVSAAIYTIVTGVGVLVAWRYANLTKRLWETMRQQVEQAKRQADTTQRMDV
jgi:hypothetical protein